MNNGRILATNDSFIKMLDISQLIGAINNILSFSSDSFAKTGLDKCLAFTLHTEKCVVLTTTSAAESAYKYRLIGLSSPDGNWYFLKHKLENLMRKIDATLLASSAE